MSEKQKKNNIHSKDDENIIKKRKESDDNLKKINKSKTLRSSVKDKTKKENKKSSKEDNISSRKVKFNSNVDIINVECWKSYNLEQTADENLEAFFLDYDDKDNNKDDKKNKKGKNNISCTCIII